jgi:hypothetical protein
MSEQRCIPSTEDLAKRLWHAERLWLNFNAGEGTPFSWENGVSYSEQNKWRYIAEHALAALTDEEGKS